MFDIWCRLLGAVPNSVLWLLEPHPAAQENLRREIELRGIESSRLIFALKMEQTAHLGRLQLADLAVDTFPCTSHTTASDALWAGVPLVTKKGETFASRVAASILNTMDLSELVTTNDEDYFHVALELAQNPEKLAAIKAKIQIQKQTSPLFDTQKFARDLERLYQTIWEQELKGERKAIVLPPKDFTDIQKDKLDKKLVSSIITLDDDVAQFFNDSTSVNNILRAIIAGLPK
jgi:predicted O-linked N-acetylglucosamine transferase (SPINDLY family)